MPKLYMGRMLLLAVLQVSSNYDNLENFIIFDAYSSKLNYSWFLVEINIFPSVFSIILDRPRVSLSMSINPSCTNPLVPSFPWMW